MGEIQIKQFMTKNGKKFAVRTALPKDADKVVTLIKTVVGEAPYLLTTEAEFNVTGEQQKQLLQQMLDDDGKLAILAEYNEEIIGFLDFYNGHRQRIKHQGSFGMIVKKDFRNQGVGKALLTVLLDWAKENPSIEKVCLEVVADNTNALRLYRNFGFVEEGLKTKAIKVDEQTYYDLILMAYFVN
jgi:RimJ/RimL family protein N-acetyltransferase